MKHLPSEKYNIAWFKLAECVSRGERERALGVYRLLSHSLADQALASQLLGDIMLAFNDMGAKEKYREAAEKYKKSGKIVEAIAVYEHLLFLEPENFEYLARLFELYKAMNLIANFMRHMVELLENGKFDIVMQVVERLDEHVRSEVLVSFCQDMLSLMVREDYVARSDIVRMIQKSLDLCMKSKQNGLLQKFLSDLEMLDPYYGAEAKRYIQQD